MYQMESFITIIRDAVIASASFGSLDLVSGGRVLRFTGTGMFNEGVFLWKRKENRIYFSDAIAHSYSGTYLKDFINAAFSPADKKDLIAAMEKILTAPGGISLDTRTTPDEAGRYYWLNIKAQSSFYKNGRIKSLSGTIEDITERKMSEEKVTQLLKIKDALLEVNHQLATIGDLDKLIDSILTKISQAVSYIDCASFLTLTADNYFVITSSIGYEPEAVKKFKLPYHELFFQQVSADSYNEPIIINDIHRMKGGFTPLARTAKSITIKSLINAPIRIENKLIGIISLDSSMNNIFGKDELEIMQYIKEQVEIAIVKFKMFEKIKFLSRHDQLTGFINRNYFEEIFEQSSKLVKRYSGTFSIAVIDIDGLKRINDSYGHLAGDTLITYFAGALQHFFRDSDTFSRFGGDEFVALFVSTSTDTLSRKFLELARYFEEKPLSFNGVKIVSKFSFGLASYPEEGNTFQELFKRADERMYRAKERKRKKPGLPRGQRSQQG